MGSGKHLMVSASGFPGTNKTWRFIQDAWREPLAALARLSGEKVILTGVNLVAGNVSSGFVSYGGEILPFVGGPVGTEVTLIETIENVVYDIDGDSNGEQDSLPGYKERKLQFGNTGVVTFPFADLVRLKSIKELSEFVLPDNIVIDADYVHTDANFTLALLAKLNGIEPGAEVNVQTDFNMLDPTNDAFFKNNPFLRRGTFYIGDFGTPGNEFDELVTVPFPSIGTTSYIAIASLTSFGSYTTDNDVNFVIKDKLANSMKVALQEINYGVSLVQNVALDYLLIKI